MAVRIKNGGIEAGLLEAVAQDRLLTAQEQNRLDYLNSLPSDQSVQLDGAGQAILPVPTLMQRLASLSRFRLKQTRHIGQHPQPKRLCGRCDEWLSARLFEPGKTFCAFCASGDLDDDFDEV